MELALRAEWFPNGKPFAERSPMPTLPVGRGPIVALEQAIQAGQTALVPKDFDLNTHHHFAPGIYVREFRMRAGDLVTGKIHKFQHLAMLVSGEAAVSTERGIERITGPVFFDSFPGAKRAVYAVTDVIFMTIHPNPSDTQNIREIEDEVTAPTFEAFEQFISEQKRLERGAA